MKRASILIVICMALWYSGNAMAGNFADCILDKAPGTSNAPAAFAAFKSCTTDHPQQYYGIEKGSGLGLFGFNDPEACIIKKSRDTVQYNAALMIANACRCLYAKPMFSGEKCAYPQVSYQVPAPEPAQPVVMTPPTTPPVITRPPPQLIPPSIAELKAEAEKKRAYEAKVKTELNAISEKAVRDYPYLDTPAGERAMNKIIRKRDELTQRGMYPPEALAQAVYDYAAANEPRPAKERPVEPVPVYPEIDKGNHVGFPPSCRWVTPQDWSCKPIVQN